MLLKRIAFLLFLGGMGALLTSCWDRVEIDQRGFVVGVAIDQAEPNDKNHKYTGTYQIVIPGGIKQSNRGASGGSSGKAYFNITTTENSMPALSAKMSSKTSRSPYFEHLKMIVISQELAKKNSNFADLLDYFLRNNEMRRGVQVLISGEKASKIFEIKSNNESMPIDYLSSIAKNNRRTNFMLPQTRIGDVHEKLVQNQSFAIQTVNIEKGDDGVSLAGSAIFAGNSKKFVGLLNGKETEGLNFMTNQINGGIIEAKIDDSVVVFLIERSKRSISLASQDPGHFKFLIRIDAQGTLDKSVAGEDPSEAKTIQSLEASIKQVIEGNALLAVQKLQQTYKKDAIGLGAFLYQNHYKIWKSVEKNWENGLNLFTQAEINVQAKVTIHRIGNIKEIVKE
ncbi:Ger(x)C family spore germination protein [Paenibacillus sp. SI8]|uniref:Ger(x)C family spore germination protein n=1 Tax=unclassified Paenibacillus TaxID=185978 RepID=UPI00346727F9